MRRTIPVVLAFVLALALIPGTAISGNRKTGITHNCHGAKVRPARIVFACGDGNFYATRLRWKRWDENVAKAWGKFHLNDCTPGCAAGTFHEVKGKLTVRGRQWCSSIDRYVFKRARVRFARSVNGERRSSFGLFCPL